MSDDPRYAVVTTVDIVRKTYAIPLHELQELNTEMPVQLDWASDCVVMGEVNHIVENVADEVILNVDNMDFESLANHLDIFDEDERVRLQIAVDNWKRND